MKFVSLRKFIYKTQKNFGWVITAVLLIIPVALWVLMQPLSVRFSSSASTLTSIGQLTGLIGIVMFALAMILSSRTKYLGALFGGMDRLYRIHHAIGILAFMFILLHPLFLAGTYALSSLRNAALFLLPGLDVSIDFGIYSLLLLFVLILITLFARFRYEIMKFLHQILGVSFLLAAAHIVLIKSDITQSIPLRAYIMSLIALGTLAYVYRTLLGRIAIKRYAYVVTAVAAHPSNIVEISMEPKDRSQKLSYLPGQFVFIQFVNDIVGDEKHPFSLSSSPYTPELRIAVKALGDYTTKLAALSVGTEARVEGPYGDFVYFKTFRPKNKKQIWIAGGSGLAPFLGMARDILYSARDTSEYVIDLYYTARSKADLAFLDELTAISNTLKHFRVIPFCADEKGYLTASNVIEESKGISGKEIFVCGPPPMMKSLKQQFADLDIPAYSVHTEEFKLL
ncbi:MAG: ferric reductase-like transmembrane domain-containing protein [Patescibacteria group bacterium]|nr:ferric reductase-like transmembrane domain-containing protein [Patescibacteria group bacterium]